MHETINFNKKENEMDNLLKDYNDVYEGLGHLHGKLHLEVDKTIEPVQHTLRKVPIATKEEPRQKLLSMEKANILKILDTLSIKINLCHMNRPYLNSFQCQHHTSSSQNHGASVRFCLHLHG